MTRTVRGATGVVAALATLVLAPTAGALPLSTAPASSATAATAAPAPADGALQVAYAAGTTTGPSVEVPLPGEPLRVASSLVGRRALEPTVAVDRDGAVYYAAANHDDSPSRVLPITEVRRSTDGGATWTNVTNRVPVAGEENPPVSADPYVWVDPDTDRLFHPEAAGACLYVNISDDGGATWTANPVTCGGLNVDHQSFGTGPFPAALAPLRTSYPNVVWYCSNRLVDASCNYSVDGGIVWAPTTPAFPAGGSTGTMVCGGLSGHLDTDRAGRLFLPKGHCGSPWLAVSEDGGRSWTRTQVHPTLTAASTHIAVATDDADNVYVVWWDAGDRLPWMAVSRDSGRTFGPAHMVAPPGYREVNFPEVEAGSEGRLVLVFPATRSGTRTDTRRPWDYVVTVTTDALSERPVFTATTSNGPADPVHRGRCGPGRCGAMWDFIDVVLSPRDGRFWSTLSDTCETPTCRAGGAVDAVSSGEGVAVQQVSGPLLRVPRA